MKSSVVSSPLRAALTSALTIDRSKIDLGFAARCAAGVAIPLVAGELAGNPAYGAAAAAGALITGFASMQGVYRTRAAAMLATAFGMGLASFAGSVAEPYGLAIVLLTALAGYAYGIIASLGPSASSVALNSIIGLVVFGRLGLSPQAAAIQAALIFGGGMFQTGLLVGVWPFRRYVVERNALATAYRSLANSARALASGDFTLPSASSLASVHLTLGDPQPFARRSDVVVFQALLDQAERIRASLGALATDRQRYLTLGARRADSLVRGALDACAAPLDDVANALLDARAPRAHSDEWLQIEEVEREIESPYASLGPTVARELHEIFSRLRAAWRIAGAPERGASDETNDFAAAIAHAPARVRLPSVAETWSRMRAHIDLASPFGRHAVRTAITLGIAAWLAHVLPLSRGYWITLTAALVLKPDYTTTFSRGIARLGGTIAGALAAAALAVTFHPSAHLDAAFTLLFATLAFVVFAANYGLFSLAVTGYVVFLLAVAGQGDAEAVRDRLLATLLGGALASAAMALWPTWEADLVVDVLATLIEAQRDFARAVFDAIVAPENCDLGKVHDAQLAVWSARVAADTSVDRAVAEAGRPGAVDPERVVGILGASRRFGLEMLALDGALPHLCELAHPHLASLRDELTTALDRAAASLRGNVAESASDRAMRVRDAYAAAFAKGSVDDDPLETVLRRAADGLADAAETLLELTAMPSSS